MTPNSSMITTEAIGQFHLGSSCIAQYSSLVPILRRAWRAYCLASLRHVFPIWERAFLNWVRFTSPRCVRFHVRPMPKLREQAHRRRERRTGLWLGWRPLVHARHPPATRRRPWWRKWVVCASRDVRRSHPARPKRITRITRLVIWRVRQTGRRRHGLMVAGVNVRCVDLPALWALPSFIH